MFAAIRRFFGRGPAASRRAPMRGVKVLARQYDMAEESRLTGDWFSGPLTADQAIYSVLAKARARAQTHERNDDLTRRYLAVMQDKVVGPRGLTYQARVRDASGAKDSAANQILEEAYAVAGRMGQVDVARSLTRVDAENMVLRRLLVDGEAIVRRWPGFLNRSGYAREFIDAARLDISLNVDRGPKQNAIVMGVEKDEFGAPVAYHFLPDDSGAYGALMAPGEARQRVPAEFIQHIFVRERPNQTRGVTWLAPTALRKHLLDGLEKAVVIKARVSAAHMGFFESERGEAWDGDGDNPDGSVAIDAEPGTFHELPSGYKLAQYNPEFPPVDIHQLLRGFKMGIASGLNISYHTIANDIDGLSFSGQRGAEMQDRDMFAGVQGFLIRHYAEPDFLAWLPLAITSGLVKLPIDKLEKFSRCEFFGRGWMWVDPVKQHAAQKLQHELGRSLRSIHLENGWDYDQELAQRAEEPDLGDGGTSPLVPTDPKNEDEAEDPKP